jgi:hypothetical protein
LRTLFQTEGGGCEEIINSPTFIGIYDRNVTKYPFSWNVLMIRFVTGVIDKGALTTTLLLSPLVDRYEKAFAGKLDAGVLFRCSFHWPFCSIFDIR